MSLHELLAGYRRATRTPLTLTLDPTRAALVAAFEARTGQPITFALLDALDDIIFDTGRQPGGTDRRPDDTTPQARSGRP